MLALGRQLARQGGLLPSCRRTMAGDAYIPKPDKSMDHVFGDSSFKLPFDFQPPSTLKTFALTVVTFGIFGFPIWIYMYEDSKMQSFLKELEAAKAKKAAAQS